jgi:hypothetical protein
MNSSPAASPTRCTQIHRHLTMTNAFIKIFFFGLCLVSCSQPRKQPDVKVFWSRDQMKIQQLVDTFKLVVRQEKDFDKQDSIRYKFAYKFYDLLSNIYIDSIQVHVDSVVVDHLTVTTVFHCNNEIYFRGSLTFLPKMDSRQDSLFKFMKGLKPGLDTIVNFAYMGNHQVRLPNSNGVPILKIFAFPTPIWEPKKQ